MPKKTLPYCKRLTFRKGKFLLEEVESPKLRSSLSRNQNWKNIGNDSYETTHLGSALAFRYAADEKLERIFKTRLQEFYKPKVHIPLAASSQLDKHQCEGIDWVLSRKRSYLAHAPGAGKTCEAIIAASITVGPGATLFIVPPSLVKNWEREIFKFTEWVGIEFPTIGIITPTVNRDTIAWNAEFIICPDSMLGKEWVYVSLQEMRFRFIAVDEASRFKEPTTLRSLCLYGGSNSNGGTFKGLLRRARHVAFLDGSPMPNRPIELWAPTFALDPESIDCMTYDEFGYRYCGAKPNAMGQWEYLYSSNEAELKEKLQKSFMHVVTEEELTHPERLRSMVILNEDVRSREHRAWEDRGGLLAIGDMLRAGMREGASLDEAARFRRLLGLRKVRLIAHYVEDKLEKGESILLFVWHREVAEKLRDLFSTYHPGMIIGGTSPEKRERFIKDFQSGKKTLLIMNIAAAGRGLNLQRADRVIFGEFSWTDETNKQCEKRASRKGSTKKNVKCDYLVAPNSMDEIVLRSIFSKERRVKRIVG